MTSRDITRRWKSAWPRVSRSEDGLIWSLLAAALVWILLLPALIPNVAHWDRGIFVSVAERLLAGDTLYVEVWDNKDPFFYYIVATGRLVSPYADIAIEGLWLLTIAFSAQCIARSVGTSRALGVLVGWAIAPVIATGAFFYPGYTHLPGTALALAAVAAVASRHFLLAGLGLGVLVFTKVTAAPIALAVVLVFVLGRRQYRGLVATFLGTSLACSGAALLLVVRGEFHPWISSLRLNARYADAGTGIAESALEHLSRVASPAATAAVLSMLLTLTAAVVFRRRAVPPPLASDQWMLWGATVTALLASLVVLALTGMWSHHAQTLYFPAILTAVVLARWFLDGMTLRPLRTLTIGGLAALLLGGVIPVGALRAARDAPSALTSLAELSPESSALGSTSTIGRTYARLGTNDDRGHAFGLRGWKLACPNFHQYAFSPEDVLRQTAECLDGADVLLLSPSALRLLNDANELDGPWGAFWRTAGATIVAEYECVFSGGVGVCTKRGSISTALSPSAFP